MAVRYSNLEAVGHRFHFRLRARGNLFSSLVPFGQGSKRSVPRGDFQLRIVLLAADHEPRKYLQQLINNIAYLERIFETMDEPVMVR